MKKTKSVYERMFNDRRLFLLGFGVLYITEMRRVKNLTRSPELRITSKGLAETWYKLFKKHGLLPKKSRGINTKENVYTFGCSVKSLYELINTVKKLPEKDMDLHLRRRLSNLVYTGSSPINKNRIKILKELKSEPLTTNELARKINFSSGNVLKNHLELLQKRGFLKRGKIGKQGIINSLTKNGKKFINTFLSEVENAPTCSLYDDCLRNKQLASDLLLIISELEMGGIMQRTHYLEMTSYEFVKFIFEVCKKWGWTNRNQISEKIRPKNKTTYVCYLNSKGTKEIYLSSGPCADVNKNKEFKNVLSLRKRGSHKKVGETKENILKLVDNNINTSKQLAFKLGIGIQNVQKPLRELVELGKLTREKVGRGHLYKRK